MKLSEFAVNRYQFTLVVFAMIVALGVTTILTMPRSEDPELSAPEFPVVVIYPGTSPKDMEELVVDPIEEKLSALEGIKKVMSNISDGIAVISVVYTHDQNVDQKYQEVVREVNAMRGELPSDIYSIDIQKWLPSNVNVIQAALISDSAPYDTLKKHAKQFKDDLAKVPSLKNVEIHGLPERLVRVDLMFDKMARMHVPLDAVIGMVQSEALNIPGGRVDAGTKSFNIQTSGNYTSVDEIRNTVVTSSGGRNIMLKDIARVYPDFEKERHITRLNGHRAVFVVAALKPGQNISAAQTEYLPVIARFKASLPPSVDLVHHFDQADNVNGRLHALGIDFMIAIALVAVTLLPLGGRASIIVMISIPISLAIGIVLLNLMGYTLNQLSIVGLVVALGLLVDDSIVVIENIERWMREGHSRLDATIKGTNQISLAVIGCTATLVVAFMPLVFLPGSSGDFIRSLPMGVIMSVLASMLVSLTIIPFMASRILKEHAGHPEGNVFLRGLKRLIQSSYGRLLDRALTKPLLTIAVALVLFAGSMALFPVIGFSLFPASEKPQFMVEITTPLQSTLDYSNDIARKVEDELRTHPEVRYYATNVGKGNPQIYYNVIPHSERMDHAQIFVQLQEGMAATRKLALIDELRRKWTPFPGARVEVKNFEQGPPILAPVEVRLFGDNLDTLRSLASQVESVIAATGGTIYVNNPVSNLKSDIRVSINKEKAAMLGVPTASIDKTIRVAVAGIPVGKMTDSEGDNSTIQIGKKDAKRNSLDALDNLFVNSMQGTAIPLAQLASLKLESSPITINHRNKTRTVAVTAAVSKGYLNDNVIRDAAARMDRMPLPSGYRFEMGGELEQRQESFGGFSSVIVVTVFLFVAILILEFKTFKSTLIVLSVVPLGIVGAVTALMLTGNSLSFVAIIGLIALAGVEVKNTILLVDFTNQLRAQGKSVEAAIREAGEVRFLPIVLTSLTAIGGLTPIALSTNPLISPLAIVIIGGLISSTLLSRVVTPVVYKLIPPAVEVH